MDATHDATVLLVEDNPGDVLMATHAIGSSDLVVDLHVAEDGAEALDFVFRKGAHSSAPRPHLVFLDINLPRVDGHAVLAAMKADEDLRSIPVVMLTSSDAVRDLRLAYAQHANAYLVKGFDFAEMQTVIRESLDYWLKRVRRLQD